MARHRKNPYTARSSSARSRQMQTQTVGTHITRDGKRIERDYAYAEGIARRVRVRRIILIIVAIIAILAFACAAGVFAFRSVVGSQLALRDSDVSSALSQAKTGEPIYIFIEAELGSVAVPLDNDSPDVLMLMRVQPEKKSIALISVPAMLQITTDNQSASLGSIAARGDAALVAAFENFTKLDINHFVKLTERDLADMVDTLGGIELNLEQVIDDPDAGEHFIEMGQQVLDGQSVLTYARSANVRMGEQDRLEHQRNVAVALLNKVFGGGSFHTRLESIGSFIQTDMSLADIEKIGGLIGEIGADSIVCATFPGYITESTEVTGMHAGRFIGSTSDFTIMLDDIENGRDPQSGTSADVGSVDPKSFSIEIQNGTSIQGAASVTGDELKRKGFNVELVGNAPAQVYDETLVVYKDKEGPAQAKTVIDALGMGRAVEAGTYYSFDTDVLVIIGSDYKPTT